MQAVHIHIAKRFVTETTETISNQQLIDEAAEAYVSSAHDTFTRICILKETFFRSIFDDRAWEHFDWLTQPSRQFSTLVSAVFRGVRQRDPSIPLPSSTEVNDWFMLFDRQIALRDLGVPEPLIPANRGTCNALLALSKDVPAAERCKVEADLLQKLEPDQPVTAKVLKTLLPPDLRPPNVRDIVSRPFDQINAEDWEKVCRQVFMLRTALLSRKEAAVRLSEARSAAKALEALTLVIGDSAIALVDDDGGFVGWAWERLVPNPAPKSSDPWKRDGYVVQPTCPEPCFSSWTALMKLPKADRPAVAHVLATAKGWEETDNLIAYVEGALDDSHRELVPIAVPLGVFASWGKIDGGAPVGIAWDELNRPPLPPAAPAE
jgi:hypothetical protein